jgi:hypothetical protein
VPRTPNDITLNTQKESVFFLNKKQSKTDNMNTNFDAISTLVQGLQFNVGSKGEKGSIEPALKNLFWPKTENVWNRAEAICMEKAKKIFSQILNGDEVQLSPAPNLKECLQILLYLREMRESASH